MRTWTLASVSNPEISNFQQVKEHEELRGGVPGYVAQATPECDAEIAEKGHFWMETTSHLKNVDQASGQVVDPEPVVGGAGRRKSGAYT